MTILAAILVSGISTPAIDWNAAERTIDAAITQATAQTNAEFPGLRDYKTNLNHLTRKVKKEKP